MHVGRIAAILKLVQARWLAYQKYVHSERCGAVQHHHQAQDCIVPHAPARYNCCSVFRSTLWTRYNNDVWRQDVPACMPVGH